MLDVCSTVFSIAMGTRDTNRIYNNTGLDPEECFNREQNLGEPQSLAQPLTQGCPALPVSIHNLCIFQSWLLLVYPQNNKAVDKCSAWAKEKQSHNNLQSKITYENRKYLLGDVDKFCGPKC